MADRVKIYVQAGNGGAGCNSFKGVRFTRTRHPDGGSGGRGADIIVKVDRNVQSLSRFQAKQHFRAENGKPGQANKKKGADGQACILRVPLGTIIRDLKENLVLADLIREDSGLVVARAGRGGRGNSRTKSATAGTPGEARQLGLELKLVSDIAIAGYPNSGKSALLARITAARVKIADYPFTTVWPFLGVWKSEDFSEPECLTIVELPGLVKGANQGKGLGAQFLRHAERARVLIHLVDMAAQERQNPARDYADLNQELRNYNPALAQKPQVLVANKMDLPEAKANLKDFRSKIKLTTYPISALTGKGIPALIQVLKQQFSKRL